jgi:hypothetical protein
MKHATIIGIRAMALSATLVLAGVPASRNPTEQPRPSLRAGIITANWTSGRSCQTLLIAQIGDGRPPALAPEEQDLTTATHLFEQIFAKRRFL